MTKSGVTDDVEDMLFLSKTEFPSLIHALSHAGLFSLSGENEPHGNFFHKLPEWMLEIAELLDKGLNETPKLTSQRSYWGFLAWTVAQVKSETKREHYEEVSELLDLLLEANGKKPVGTELFKKAFSATAKPRLVSRVATSERKSFQQRGQRTIQARLCPFSSPVVRVLIHCHALLHPEDAK